MAINLTKVVKPSDFNLQSEFMGSSFGKSELETIARNVVIICKKCGDEWKPFSFDDYASRCEHTVTRAEQSTLDYFVRENLLSFHGGEYCVTTLFIAKLAQFIQPE